MCFVYVALHGLLLLSTPSQTPTGAPFLNAAREAVSNRVHNVCSRSTQ